MCSSPPSSLPISATSHVSSNPICTYNVDYHDGSHSDGFFAKEKLTLTPADVLANFQFGCGQNNYGTFGDTAGIFGLGPGPRSFVSQTAQIYAKFFSYCLPTHSSTGNLIFGRGDARRSRTVKFTALSIEHGHYSITMQGITMDGKRLDIPVQVLSTPPTVVDSGADITYLPPSAYATMRSVFRSKMSKYPIIPPIEPFDTCYDFSRYKYVLVPKISFYFNGGVEVELDANGILHWLDGHEELFGFCSQR
ncbi:hypothetical protein L1049_018900 [Liquidambar formosana]|uniref:Peptidase A1 domain-containing protein n=1 Tax=Liquidambar formosana TaxID=63359 RepID=A0AAP0RAQ6_LIQFO